MNDWQGILHEGIRSAHYAYKQMTSYWWLSDAGSEGFLSTVVAQRLCAADRTARVFVELPVGKIRRTQGIDAENDRDKQRIDIGVVDSEANPTVLIEMKRVHHSSHIEGVVSADVRKLEKIRRILGGRQAPLQLFIGACVYGYGSDDNSCARKLDRIFEAAHRAQWPHWAITAAKIDLQNFDDESPAERVWEARSLVISRAVESF